MRDIVLYCKSYRADVLRAVRLAKSVERFNADAIPFYLSVPREDLPLFREHLPRLTDNILSDEDILRANPAIPVAKAEATPGGLMQQVIKSEFWRLGLSDSYLCLDSDCEFLRPFSVTDFLTPGGVPYTLMHESRELHVFFASRGMERERQNYFRLRAAIMQIFGREGRPYDFGPPPFIWSAAVWRVLDERFLKPNGMSYLDAICCMPSELLWYGEALLKFRPIELFPIEPLFRFYHYEIQMEEALAKGEDRELLAKCYPGVVYQSNWERSMDFGRPRKSVVSRIARWIRRHVFHRYR